VAIGAGSRVPGIESWNFAGCFVSHTPLPGVARLGRVRNREWRRFARGAARQDSLLPARQRGRRPRHRMRGPCRIFPQRICLASSSKQVGRPNCAGQELRHRLLRCRMQSVQLRTADCVSQNPALTADAADKPRFGREFQRSCLGQGAFPVLVTDAYERRYESTEEKTTPVLEAAHIKPYSEGPHQVSNRI